MFHSFRSSWAISFYPSFSYSVHFMAVCFIAILFTTTGPPAFSFLFLGPTQFNSNHLSPLFDTIFLSSES